MSAKRKFILWLPYTPLIITAVLFLAAVLYTDIGCNSLPTAEQGECALGWAWLFLAPVFAAMFFVSLIFALIVGILILRKYKNPKHL
jgi:hypothetical protein